MGKPFFYFEGSVRADDSRADPCYQIQSQVYEWI